MSEDWGAIAADVLEAIASVDMNVTLRRPGEMDESTYPPTLGEGTSTTFKGTQTKLSFSDRQDANTQSGDIKFLLAVGDTDPVADDTLEVAGRRYNITSVERVAPDGIVVLWKVMARGGSPVSG